MQKKYNYKITDKYNIKLNILFKKKTNCINNILYLNTAFSIIDKIFLQEIANAEIQKNNKLRFFCNSCFIYLFRFDCIKSIFIPKNFTPIRNLEDELLQKIMGL